MEVTGIGIVVHAGIMQKSPAVQQLQDRNCLASPKKTGTNSTNYHESRVVWPASREIILRGNS